MESIFLTYKSLKKLNLLKSMDNIKLKEGTLEVHPGRNIDKAPALLERWAQGKGYIPSEADIRLLGIRNFKNASDIANNYWDTSTLSATKGDVVKVILPYEIGSKYPSGAARFGLSLINPNENLVNYGVNLDVDNRWETLEGNGVYTLKRKELILNQDLTEKQAMKHELLLTKLGHPDYVDAKFARSKDEVAEIIGKTFELGKKEHGYKEMMGQYLSDVNDKGILKAWYVDRLDLGAGSGARSNLDDDDGQLPFVSVGDAKINAESKSKIFTGSQDVNQGVNVDQARMQLKTLETILQPEQINEIGIALNERDNLKERVLTTDQIYSVIGSYIGSANEKEVKKVLNKLTSQ